MESYENSGQGLEQRSGTLALEGDTREEVLSRDQDRLALCINSFSTPAGGAVFRLVDVAAGRPEDFAGKDLHGAVALGDAPIAGCGFYVDDMIGGVAISGDGESIIRVTLASRVMRALETFGPAHAARTALTSLARVGGEAGIIALGKDGRFGVAFNSEQFAVAMANDRMPDPRAGVEMSEYEDVVNDS